MQNRSPSDVAVQLATMKDLVSRYVSYEHLGCYYQRQYDLGVFGSFISTVALTFGVLLNSDLLMFASWCGCLASMGVSVHGGIARWRVIERESALVKSVRVLAIELERLGMGWEVVHLIRSRRNGMGPPQRPVAPR